MDFNTLMTILIDQEIGISINYRYVGLYFDMIYEVELSYGDMRTRQAFMSMDEMMHFFENSYLGVIRELKYKGL